MRELSKARQASPLQRVIDEKRAPFRINFVGGEPLMLGGNRLAAIIERAMRKYGFTASLVTNGSLLIKNMEVVDYLETLGLSVDSFSGITMRRIGRCSCRGQTMSEVDIGRIVKEARERNPKIRIKFNVVVNQYNYRERIVMKLMRYAPDRVKIFRQMPFGDKKGITDLMFKEFLEINSTDQTPMVVEDNDDMTTSYLMIDPEGRFFQNGNGDLYAYSSPIHQVGVESALNEINFAPEKYLKRYEG